MYEKNFVGIANILAGNVCRRIHSPEIIAHFYNRALGRDVSCFNTVPDEMLFAPTFFP
jgi:hypothetical protein